MWQSALVASLILLGQVTAGIPEDAGLLVRMVESVDGDMQRHAVETIARDERDVRDVQKRQSNITATTTTTTMSTAEWDAQTMAACQTALEELDGVASNDAGMAVCYNLPYYDNTTGVFQADMRLFTISAPTGAFAAIPSQNVQVGLSYVGATVSAVNASTIGRRGETVSLISWPRNELSKRTASIPVMAQAYAFVGQINKEFVGTSETDAATQKLLIPQVTLTGTDTTGKQVNTTLNTGEATFVSGTFAQEVAVTKTAVTAPIQTLVVASDAPFVLPGQNILIFPIGGIITGVWAVLLVATIGYGTFGRMQFRDQYRVRSARANKGDIARI